MKQDFFANLPSEIIINILSRLPVRTIISCKCVCKSWFNLLETDEFAKSHLSKSVPGLAIYQSGMDSDSYKIFEFEDGLDLQHHELHYNLVTKLDLPHASFIQGSADGLLFLRDLRLEPHALYICNPITRHFIELHCPQGFVYCYPQVAACGFAASKMTGQYKVVVIFRGCIRDQETHELLRISKSECQVYTLGTGSWRTINAPSSSLEYSSRTIGAFLNGNLHWLVLDLNGSPWISCCDLETELFSIVLSPPPLPLSGSIGFLRATSLLALGDCLCLCDNISDDEIVIWLMKEYGVEKSWTKEFVISKIPDFVGGSCTVVYPIKVFKDGDILMSWQDFFLFCYSNKTKTTQSIDMFEVIIHIDAILHTPSFLSLKSFGLENVSSF